jgi:hypothetical protein
MSAAAQDITWPGDRASALAPDFAVTAYGATVGVAVDDATLIPILKTRLPAFAREMAPGSIDSLVAISSSEEADGRPRFDCHDGVVRRRSDSLDDLLGDFEAQLRFAFAQWSRREVFLHAGVVGWKGQAILLPGRSHAGKTSLVAALIAAGAEYFSDEHAVIDSDGWVHPAPKPLSVRDRRDGRQRNVDPGAFSAGIAATPLRAGLVVVTRFRHGAHWRPRPMTAGESALALMENAVAARIFPERVTHAVAAVARRAKAIASDRPEAARVAPRILDALERRAGHDRE